MECVVEAERSPLPMSLHILNIVLHLLHRAYNVSLFNSDLGRFLPAKGRRHIRINERINRPINMTSTQMRELGILFFSHQQLIARTHVGDGGDFCDKIACDVQRCCIWFLIPCIWLHCTSVTITCNAAASSCIKNRIVFDPLLFSFLCCLLCVCCVVWQFCWIVVIGAIGRGPRAMMK